MTPLDPNNRRSAFLHALGVERDLIDDDNAKAFQAVGVILREQDPAHLDEKAQALFWKEKLSHDGSTVWPVAFLPSGQVGSASQRLELRIGVLQTFSDPTDFWVAVWGLLLARYSGENVVIFGVPCVYSIPSETNKLVATLPLSIPYDAKLSFGDWMNLVRNARQELTTAGPATLALISEWSGRSPATPLFESRIALDLEPEKDFEFTEWIPPISLRIAMSAAPSLEWDSARLDDEAAHRLAGHLETLATALLQNPHQACGQVPLTTAAERQQILVDWNSVRADYPDLAIHDVIEARAVQTPDAIAVSCEGTELTYRELSQRSTDMARRLVAFGVKPDTLVPICVSRSVNMFVGILAILKAGGAYVPLDPNYPADRLAFVLEEVASPFLVTEKALAGKLPAGNATIELVDVPPEAVCSQALPKVHPDNLAYAIYTSGSTGKPKGVLITHRNLASSTASRVAYYGPGHTNFLLLSSYAFDSSVAGIFWMLTTGGTLTIVPEEAAQDLTQIDHLVTRRGITTMLCLPSLYLLLLERWQSAAPAKLKCVIVAGEACIGKLVEQHQRQLPHAILFNEYGPTEGTVWSNVQRCDQPLRSASVPIGRAIPNSRVYLLDSNFQPVPIGIAGEICIGGDGVARGYWNRPELTAERFVPNPFVPGERLYLTGDYGRFLADGAVEFLGRRDQQVKVRGFRIELGEIEAVLAQAPGVNECVVLVREDQPGDQRLVAYVSMKSGAEFSVSALRQHVRVRLPEYMVPMAVMRLADFARTATGKIDRKVLPVPDAGATASSAPFLAPGSLLEQQIADLWKKDLKLATVGVDDNFFDIGGHSLSLVRIHQALQKVLAREIPITELFQYPTIRSLAAQLGDQRDVPSLAEKTQSRAQLQRAALARNRRPVPQALAR
jgi:surfactin family lipopeptide synthetase A